MQQSVLFEFVFPYAVRARQRGLPQTLGAYYTRELDTALRNTEYTRTYGQSAGRAVRGMKGGAEAHGRGRGQARDKRILKINVGCSTII